ncbi:hypothetical protein ACFQ0B_54545 [Nonomuraea thailandensis]
MNRTSAKAAVIGAAVLALAACASAPPQGGPTAAGAEGGAYTWWDPYPQHDASSAWAERVGACGGRPASPSSAPPTTPPR